MLKNKCSNCHFIVGSNLINTNSNGSLDLEDRAKISNKNELKEYVGTRLIYMYCDNGFWTLRGCGDLDNANNVINKRKRCISYEKFKPGATLEAIKEFHNTKKENNHMRHNSILAWIAIAISLTSCAIAFFALKKP